MLILVINNNFDFGTKNNLQFLQYLQIRQRVNLQTNQGRDFEIDFW